MEMEMAFHRPKGTTNLHEGSILEAFEQRAAKQHMSHQLIANAIIPSRTLGKLIFTNMVESLDIDSQFTPCRTLKMVI